MGRRTRRRSAAQWNHLYRAGGGGHPPDGAGAAADRSPAVADECAADTIANARTYVLIVFKLGVAGVAIATIIAQIFSWIFGIFYINPLQGHREFPIKTELPAA